MLEVLMLLPYLSTDYSETRGKTWYGSKHDYWYWKLEKAFLFQGYTVDMDFTCPTCNVPLRPQKLGDVLLWKCVSCSGLVVSLPTVRKGLNPGEFKKIWQQLYSGKTESGRPCPGCRKPLKVVKADGQDDQVLIDLCRNCQILWFDDEEFSVLHESELEPEYGDEQEDRPESRLLTPEEIMFAAFKREQHQRRSFLLKLLDGSVLKELGFDTFLGK